MKSIWNIITLLFITTIAAAQDLAQKIPHDAFAVVNIQTDHFFKLMNVDDFNRSTVGRAILEKANEAGLDAVGSITDFGIALDRSSYFHTKLTDSVIYFGFLLPIAQTELFERHFVHDETVYRQGSFQYFAKEASGDSIIFAWDNQMLSITGATLVDNYFQQADVAERYGIHNYSYYNYYNQLPGEPADTWADAWAEPDTLAETIEIATAPPALPDTTYEDWWPADSIYEAADSAVYWDGYDDDLLDEPSQGDNTYETYYAADQAIKRQLASQWAQAFARAQFDGTPIQSVLTNRDYLSSRSKDALVSAWIPDFEAIYTSLLPDLREFGSSGKLFSYYGSVRLGLYADKEGFKLESEMQIADDMAKRFKRMYNRKLNRKFLNYINTDEAIGFFSVSMNTQAYLEELPALMKNTYGSLFARYEEDIDLGAELLSLVIDEKALAKVAKGDGLFVLNGVAEQEVPYITYEYDDDYNYHEVEKTKTEVVPDFLFMFSSDDAALYQRVMSYVAHKGHMLEENGVHTLVNTPLPFELLFTRKNGIVFIGTSADQLTAIASNRYRGKLDRHSRRLLTKNKVAGLLSAKKLSAEIPTEQLASLDRYIAFHKLFGSMGDFYFSSNGIKGNTVSGEFVAQAPGEFDNAVQYLFVLVDYALAQQ